MERESKGVMATIAGVVLIIFGFWLKDEIWITSYEIQPYTGIKIATDWIVLEPYGILLIAIGAAVLILGIWLWTSSAHKPKPPTKPPVKAKKQKIVRPERLSTLMTDLKFGVFFIVAGFLIRLLLVNVIAEEYTDVEKIISVGDWLLILFVIIGILIVGYGIVEYSITGKQHR